MTRRERWRVSLPGAEATVAAADASSVRGPWQPF